MRIRDWSSDVCASSLLRHAAQLHRQLLDHVFLQRQHTELGEPGLLRGQAPQSVVVQVQLPEGGGHGAQVVGGERSEERRVGKKCGSMSRTRWSTDHEEKKDQKRDNTEYKIKSK